MELKFGPRVTQVDVDRVLLYAGISFNDEYSHTWNEYQEANQKRDNLVIDLADVTFAEVSALGVLIITLQHLCNRSAGIKVIPPESDDARGFVTSARFCHALAESPGQHWQVDAPPAMFADRRHRRMLPLSWVRRSDEYESFLSSVLSEPLAAQTDVLHPSTVATLARLVFFELVDNVQEHSDSPAALVGAIAVGQSRVLLRSDYLEGQAPYTDNHKEKVASFHLFVGDPGLGIVSTLRTVKQYEAMSIPELMTLASQRWTSRLDRSEVRGTRGLYRVARLAERYQGLLTIRSGRNYSVPVPNIAQQTNAKPLLTSVGLPGTCLTLEVPLGTNRPWPKTIESLENQFNLKLADLKSVSEVSDYKLHELVKQTASDEILVISLVNITIQRQELVAFLRLLSSVSHSTMVAVQDVQLTDDELDLAAEDVNSEIDRDFGQDLDQILDASEPILLVGHSYETTWWAGTTPEVANMLLTHETAAPLLPLMRNLGVLQTSKNGAIFLRLSGATLARSAEHHLRVVVNSYKESSLSGAIIMPSLRRVTAYFDVLKLLRLNVAIHTLAARLIIMRLEKLTPAGIPPQVGLLFEGGIDERFVRTMKMILSEWGGGRVVEVDRFYSHDVRAGRALSIYEKFDVIVVTSGVGSGHTMREMIAVSMRQGYRVKAAASVLDTRSAPDQPISIWETSFFVTSALLQPVEVGARASHKRDRILETSEGARKKRLDLDLPLSTLLGELRREKEPILQLGHFVGGRDRHFTFYLNPEMLLNSAAFRRVRTVLAARLSEFLDEARVQTHLTTSKGFVENKFAREITHEVLMGLTPEDQRQVKPYNRPGFPSNPESIAVVHWGVLSAESLMQQATDLVARGAKQILFLIAFSQMPDEQETFLRSVDQLTDSNGNPCTVSFYFACRLPIVAYRQELCPLCFQARNVSMGTQTGESPGLLSQREAEMERLRVRPSIEGLSRGPDAISLRTPGASTELIVDALEVRGQLVDAQGSTLRALRAASQLEAWMKQPSWLVAVATLLVFEPDWLLEQPLRNDSIRSILAESLRTFILERVVQTFDDSHEYTRVIIALRLVSKTMFSASLAAMLGRHLDRREIFDLIAYLTSSLLSREYISRTGLPVVIESQLLTAERELPDIRVFANERIAIEELLDRVRAIRASRHLDDDPDLLVWERFHRALARAHHHDIARLFEDARPGTSDGEDLGAAAVAWAEVNKYLRVRLKPLIERFRDLLVNTRVIVGSYDFAKVFGVPEHLGSSDAAEHALADAAQRGRRLDESEWDRIIDTHDALSRLIFDPERPSLERALQQCLTFSQIAYNIDLHSKRAGVQVDYVGDPSFDLPLFVPNDFLNELLKNIFENIVRYSTNNIVKIQVDAVQRESVLTGVVAFSNLVDEKRVLSDVDLQSGKRPGGLSELVERSTSSISISRSDGVIQGKPYFEVKLRVEGKVS